MKRILTAAALAPILLSCAASTHYATFLISNGGDIDRDYRWRCYRAEERIVIELYPRQDVPEGGAIRVSFAEPPDHQALARFTGAERVAVEYDYRDLRTQERKTFRFLAGVVTARRHDAGWDVDVDAQLAFRDARGREEHRKVRGLVRVPYP